MKRLYELGDWTKLGPGEVLTAGHSEARVVRLDIVLSQPGILTVAEGDNTLQVFLADGTETVEFYVSGVYAISADVDIAVYTADSITSHIVDDGQPSFTRIVERRVRNPEMEAMEARMHANMARMLAAQNDERERVFAARMAAMEAKSGRIEPSPTAGAVNVENPPASLVGGNEGGVDDPAS